MDEMFNCVTSKGKLTGDSCFGCKVKSDECDLYKLLQEKQERDKVKCENCKRFELHKDYNIHNGECIFNRVPVYLYDFCSYFEPKERET